jgi:SAM-dependent methyltransferase
MADSAYIHGTEAPEQRRLAVLNELTNPSFIEFLDLGETDSILEVGSGLGLLAREIARLRPRANVLGIEYSPNQLERADTSGRPNLRFAQGDGHHLELKAGQFDVVYCRWLLEHVADPVRVLREMRRVLKPGGRIFVQENDVSLQRYDPRAPRAESFWGKIVELQKRLGGDALIGSRLHGLLSDAGFRKIDLSLAPEIHSSGTRGFAVWIENEIGIFTGCAGELVKYGLTTPPEVEAAVAELRDFLKRPRAVSLFAWNRAKSRK